MSEGEVEINHYISFRKLEALDILKMTLVASGSAFYPKLKMSKVSVEKSQVHGNERLGQTEVPVGT